MPCLGCALQTTLGRKTLSRVSSAAQAGSSTSVDVRLQHFKCAFAICKYTSCRAVAQFDHSPSSEGTGVTTCRNGSPPGKAALRALPRVASKMHALRFVICLGRGMMYEPFRLMWPDATARTGKPQPDPHRKTMTPSHSDNAPPSESVIAQDAGLDIKDLIGILRRRKKVILATVVLLTTLAVLVGLQVTRKYTATALVMIDPSQSKIVDVESVIQGLGTDASTVESQMRVISSRFQLEHLADDLGIFEDPEFNVALRNPDRDVQMQVQGPFEYLLSWVPDEWLVATGLAAEPSDTAGDDIPALQHEATIEAFGEPA